MPTHEHLFHPGHAQTARRIMRRGWPSGYLAVCVLCGQPVDLVAVLSPSGPPAPDNDDGGGDPSGPPPP